MITTIATVDTVRLISASQAQKQEQKQAEGLQRYEITLRCEQKSSCQSCSSHKDCGAQTISKAFGKKIIYWQLTTEKKVEVGQLVEIGLPERSLLISALIVYLLPIAGLFVGALIGQYWLVPWFSMGEGLSIVTGAAGAFAAFLMGKYLAKTQEKSYQEQLVLLRVLGAPISSC